MQIISSRDNEKIKQVAKLIKSKQERKENGLFVAEGLRICYDASQIDDLVESVFFTESVMEKYPDKVQEIIDCTQNVYQISDHVMDKITDTKTSQQIVCVCKIVDKTLTNDKIGNKFKYLALENISDPGNMGTIIRTSEALGIDGIILTGSCADIYSPKVVRATMGSIFRIPVYFSDDSLDIIERFNKNGVSTWASVLDNPDHFLSKTDMSNINILFIGSEGNGLNSTTSQACDYRITIDMKGRAESLNASTAASILMWEMCKKA